MPVLKIRIKIHYSGSLVYTKLSPHRAMTLLFLLLCTVSTSHLIHYAGTPNAMSTRTALQLWMTSINNIPMCSSVFSVTVCTKRALLQCSWWAYFCALAQVKRAGLFLLMTGSFLLMGVEGDFFNMAISGPTKKGLQK